MIARMPPPIAQIDFNNLFNFFLSYKLELQYRGWSYKHSPCDLILTLATFLLPYLLLNLMGIG